MGEPQLFDGVLIGGFLVGLAFFIGLGSYDVGKENGRLQAKREYELLQKKAKK